MMVKILEQCLTQKMYSIWSLHGESTKAYMSKIYKGKFILSRIRQGSRSECFVKTNQSLLIRVCKATRVCMREESIKNVELESVICYKY